MHVVSAAAIGQTIDMGFAYPPGFEPELSEEEVLVIQFEYLRETLKLLDDARASTNSYRDAIEWIAVPLIPTVRKGEISCLSVVAFQRCCYVHGVNPETMQETLLRMFAPDRLVELGYE